MQLIASMSVMGAIHVFRSDIVGVCHGTLRRHYSRRSGRDSTR